MGQQVSCQQTTHACNAGGPVRRRPVQTDPQTGGMQRLQALGQQTDEYAAEHISHATAGHTGVAVTAEVDDIVGADQRARTLENRDTAIALLQLAHGGKAVGLDISAGALQQAGGLTRMRGEYPVVALRILYHPPRG